MKNLSKSDYLNLYPECKKQNLGYIGHNCQNRCLFFKKKKVIKVNCLIQVYVVIILWYGMLSWYLFICFYIS